MGTKSAEIRAGLGHPVIDCDGHYLELSPVIAEYVEKVGGPELATRFRETYLPAAGEDPGARTARGYFTDPSTPHERRERGDLRWPVYWVLPERNTLDRATATLPRLLHERLGDFGLDFSVLYPSFGLTLAPLEEAELRRAYCRAFNTYTAETFRPYSDRLTPAAVIPLHTPDEGIEELEYAVKTLGLKAVMIPTYIRRPVQALLDSHPDLAFQAGTLDMYGLESDYDYDPFWAKCVELKVVPATHSTGMGWGSRRSYGNFVYNHLGHFAAASEGLCKSLILGGVLRRFPALRMAFLECGVGWACSLYADMISHWEKRNPVALENTDPTKLDVDLFMKLVAEYGDDKVTARLEEIRPLYGRPEPQPPVDDWEAVGIERAEQFRDLFETHFYFGCEADDPVTAWAFNTKVNPFGARLHPLLASDISHFDVVDMTRVLEEAYELVENGAISEADLRDLTFANPARLFGGVNPDFFEGTCCEAEVAALLG